MKSAQFIERSVRTIENEGTAQKRLCSSILVDGDTIYSYGYHYPLLFRIEDKNGRMVWVCNNTGYSATTRKHISWAGSCADIFAQIGNANRGMFSRTVSKSDVIDALQVEREALKEEMNSKKRTDTAIYRILQSRYDRVSDNLAQLV